MSDQVRRTTADRLNDASDVTGQIVQGRAVERTATASDATHINRDRLEPSGNQRARQMIKIACATARIREQHDWCADTAKCAFQGRVSDLDGTMLLHSHLPLLCRCNHKAGARKMHANLADLAIAASDHDLMDVRGDQFTGNQVASGLIRGGGNGLARLPTDGILGIGGRPGDRCGIPCYIKRLSPAHWASPAMADSRNALSPSQEPRKAVERRRRQSEVPSQEPNRMIGGEI